MIELHMLILNPTEPNGSYKAVSEILRCLINLMLQRPILQPIQCVDHGRQ